MVGYGLRQVVTEDPYTCILVDFPTARLTDKPTFRLAHKRQQTRDQRPEQTFRLLDMPTPSVLCTAPKAREVEVVNHLFFPFGIHTRAPPVFPVSRAKLSHGVSYVSPLLPTFFLPLAPRLQAASLRKIVHMQAGQCGNQMGSKL